MSHSITQLIKDKAIELGFSLVRVTSAAPLDLESERLKEWLEKKYYASMEWIKRTTEKRIDIFKVMPDVKSIICLALNYYTNVNQKECKDCGKISRYAWGKDYHFIIEEKLKALYNFINELLPNITGKYYVDSGPVMEKVWAERSGIGWIGKHTNIITKNYGSWVFLGEILIDYKLEPDNPIKDFCGTCTACIEACPTKAIVQPYVLDSRKCISYLTIEHKDELPTELISDFQNWIFGCDICQQVCPWNRFQKQTNEKSFMPFEYNISPKLAEIINLSKEEFDTKYKESPIKRAKHSGFLRNAKAVLEVNCE